MMRPKVTEEVIHTDHIRYPDHIELGKAGARLSVAFNADDPEEAIDRIDQAMLVFEYGRNEIMKRIEQEIKRIREAKN